VSSENASSSTGRLYLWWYPLSTETRYQG
jgi:hypothetical protein